MRLNYCLRKHYSIYGSIITLIVSRETIFSVLAVMVDSVHSFFPAPCFAFFILFFPPPCFAFF